MKLLMLYNGETVATFDTEEHTLEDVISAIDALDYDDRIHITFETRDVDVNDNDSNDSNNNGIEDNSDESIDNSMDNVSELSNDTIRNKEEIEERVVEVEPGKNYTIWSSSDFAEEDEQIPLVNIYFDDNGEATVEALSSDAFDTESAKIAASSLKYTKGKDLKTRLQRVDKSLNHNDPYMSTETQRYAIRANRGDKNKKSVKDIVGGDPSQISDKPRTEKELKAFKQSKQKTDDIGLRAMASQVLITNRDDLKAAANKKSASEEELAALFSEMTGVNYYTEKIVDQEQYDYLLDLLGRSSDKYSDSHLAPDENGYVQGLKDLTEDLIEKVLLKQNPDFYNKGSK